jgi:hypothetical protein
VGSWVLSHAEPHTHEWQCQIYIGGARLGEGQGLGETSARPTGSLARMGWWAQVRGSQETVSPGTSHPRPVLKKREGEVDLL